MDEPGSMILGLATFIPQQACMIAVGICFYYDLFFCLFIQTWLFVIFNKVATAQYLLWWLSWLPLAAINSDMIRTKWYLFAQGGACCIAAFATWGYYAHHFEHEFWPTIQ